MNNLFKHPYTKIDFLERDIKVTRQTAATYLNKLADADLLVKIKIGKSNFYMNSPLYQLFLNGVPPAQAVEPVATITT